MILKSLLNPSYSFFDYKFEEFHPLKMDNLKIIKKPLENKNKLKNSKRYIRISLESLDEYSSKKNRRVKEFDNTEIREGIDKLLNLLNRGDNKIAYNELLEVIKLLSDGSTAKFF